MKIVQEAWTSVREFFDRPEAMKSEVAMSDSYPYGYGGMNTEKTGGEREGAYDTSDLKESFQVCLSSETKPAAIPEVRWPREPPSLPAHFTAYYRAMEDLAQRLLLVFAKALGLGVDFFPPLCDSHWSALRALNYPEQTRPPNPGQLRIAPHSDYGVLTILRADNAPGGLEVLRADGTWSPVVIPEDCFCVNLGDLMQRWTNDEWKSTVHRVCKKWGLGLRQHSFAFLVATALPLTPPRALPHTHT